MIRCQNITAPQANRIEPALALAEEVCRDRGTKLREVPRRILEVLAEGYEPLGAYELLERLGQAMHRRFAPPTIYRALEFLLAHRLIARIESRNAFVLRAHPQRDCDCIFLSCDQCGAILQMPCSELGDLLSRNAKAQGFVVRDKIIEVRGVCTHRPDGRQCPK